MKPTFRLTKGERKGLNGSIETCDIMRHYRNRMRGRGEWDGLPEDMPYGYIESVALWYSSGFAIKKVPGMGLGGFPANPETLDIYGNPVDWLPAIVNGVTAFNQSDSIYKPAKTPVLYIGTSYEDQIRPYCQLMEQTLKTLGQNLNALAQPILVNGRPVGSGGDNIGGIMLASDLSAGKLFVPCVSGDGMPLEVLDLHATDNTQNLISVLQMCDARILEILDLSNGIEKSSGISDMETATGALGLDAGQNGFEELAKEWCDKTNDMLGTSISYRTRKAEPPKQEMNDEDEQEDGEDAMSI